jgi:hypothetical protein
VHQANATLRAGAPSASGHGTVMPVLLPQVRYEEVNGPSSVGSASTSAFQIGIEYALDAMAKFNFMMARVTTIAQKGGPARRGMELRTPGLTGHERGGREWSG